MFYMQKYSFQYILIILYIPTIYLIRFVFLSFFSLHSFQVSHVQQKRSEKSQRHIKLKKL